MDADNAKAAVERGLELLEKGAGFLGPDAAPWLHTAAGLGKGLLHAIDAANTTRMASKSVEFER